MIVRSHTHSYVHVRPQSFGYHIEPTPAAERIPAPAKKAKKAA